MRLIACLAAAALVVSPAPVHAQDASRAVKQGIEKGFTSCAASLDALVKRVNTNDAQYSHLGVWAKVDPDSHVFDTTTIQKFSDGTQIVAFSGIKNALGKCDLVMTQVLPVLESGCTALRESAFKEWKFLQEISGVPLYERPDSPAETAMLSPLGSTGCLILKRYVSFG